MHQILAHFRVDLIHHQRDRLAQRPQQLGQIAIGAVISVRPSMTYKMCDAMFERNARLLQNLGWGSAHRRSE